MEFYHHDFLQNIDNLDKIIEQISKNTTTIKDLVIDPLVGTELSSADCKRLSQAILKNTHIENFDCAGHQLGDQNAKLLLTSLRKCKTLKQIDLSYNSLECTFLSDLSLLLRMIFQHYHTNIAPNLVQSPSNSIKSSPNTYQMTLILDDNKLGDNGAKQLSKSIKLGYITDLRVRSNKITSEGALFLFRAATSPLSKLKSLHLNGNLLGSQNSHNLATLKLISKYLSSSSCSLKHLDLGDTSLSDSDLLSILSSSNSSLSYIGLEANNLTEKSAETICNAIKSKYGKPIRQWNLQRNNRLLYVNVDKDGLLRPKDHLLVWDPWIIANSHFFSLLNQTLSENNHVIFVDIGDKINLIESELVSQFEAQLSANKIIDNETKRNRPMEEKEVITKGKSNNKYIIAGLTASLLLFSVGYFYYKNKEGSSVNDINININNNQ